MKEILLFASPGAQGGGFLAYLPFVLILLIMYFLMIRPQVKRQKEKQAMLSALKKGDHVVTIGGIHGTIAGFKNNNRAVALKIDKNTNITVNRSAIAGLRESVTDADTSAIEA